MRSESTTQVLVSFVKPHKALSFSTVSRRLKQILEIAGIDTDIFKVHSTRAALSTKADISEVSVSDIMKHYWSRDSTFNAKNIF